MAADSWGVMGMLWGHFGMCARVLRAARSWPAHAAPRTSPVFAGSRSSSMSGAAGGVSHGSVVSVVGNVPSCVPRGRDASREDLQIGVDESGRYVVLVKQLVQCARIVKASAARDDWTFPPFPDGFENLINLFGRIPVKIAVEKAQSVDEGGKDHPLFSAVERRAANRPASRLPSLPHVLS